MKIIIAASASIESVNLIEQIIVNIKNNIESQNIVDSFILPYNPKGEAIKQELAVKLVDLRNECDMLIAIDYPMCMLEHNRKIVLFSCMEEESQRIAENYNFDDQKVFFFQNGYFYSTNGRVVDFSEVVA